MAYSGVLNDFKACVEMRKPSRMPVLALGLRFDTRLAGLSHRDARNDVDGVLRAQTAAIGRFDYDWVVVFPDDYIEFEPLGLTMRDDENLPAMPAEYLPMHKDTIKTLRIPNAAAEMRLPIHLEMIRRAKQAFGDTVCVCGRIAAPFSALSLVYGVDALLTNLLDDPDLVLANLSFFTEHQIAFGKAQIEAGADLLWLGDCVASSSFVSPAHFTAFVAESAARVAARMTALGAVVIYHSAETSFEHLRLQMELPVSAINVGEGISIAEIKKRCGSHKCLLGNFDPLLLRDGGPEEVAQATERMIHENVPGGPYIFSTGEGIMEDSSAESVEAMMRTAKTLSIEALSTV